MVFENEINLYGDAPIANKFSTQDTKFDVVQGHINAIVSESEMIELIDSGKTMYSGMNDIKVDVTGIHGNISSLTTRIDGQSQQITQINSKQAQYEATLDEFSASLSDTQSDLETTNQNLATLQLDTSQFKTTVSNTYSTKTQAQGYASSAQSAAISAAASDATSKANAAEANANAATDNKLRNYSTTSSVSSMIDQKADAITLAVSRTYATKDEAQTAARTTITGDTIYYLAYANNTGVTTSTSGWTPDPTASSAQISESKKYLWTYHKYTYGDGHTSDTTPVVTGTFGTKGDTIDNVRYQQGSSPTNPPTGTWSPNVPPVDEGKYLWTRITYTGGNVSYSVAKQGTSGTSVTVLRTEYQAGTSPTNPPTGTWYPNVQSVADGNYLWTRVTYSDTNVAYSVAKQGQQGTSVTVLSTEYQAGTSPTSAPTGTWYPNVPSVAEGNYLWTKVTYSDNNIAYSVAKQGKSGTDGKDGKDGTSVTVLATEYAYQLSENGTTPPTGTWSPTPVAPTDTKYAWTRTTTTFSDGNVAVIYTVGGKSGMASTVYELSISTATVVRQKDGTYNPSSIVLNSKKHTGGAQPSTYAGRFTVDAFSSTGVTTRIHTSSANESAYTCRNIPSDTSEIVCTLYAAGGTSTQLDKQIVPVVNDGSDAYTVFLDNDNQSFSCDENGAIAATAYSRVVVYKGATRIAATIGSISTPTGITAEPLDNGTVNARVKFTVAKGFKIVKSGQISIPITFDTNQSATKAFTFSLALRGIGISKVTPLYYAKNNNTAPAKPSSKITTTTINTGVWTTGLPSLTNTYKYLFTCDQIEYDDSSSHIEWTTVVENKNTADLYTRLTTAEQKITDSAIIQTVTASGQFPAKGDIILAINEVGQSVAKINAEKLELSSYTPIDRFIKATVDKNGSFCGDGAPTTSNYPASLWSDDDTKMSHVGDIYYNTSNGFSYQYGVISGGLLIKFNQNSRTENYYDYVIIYYKLNNVVYASSKFTGNIGAAEFFVPSNEFWVYWHTDTSSHDFYGFSFSSVTTVNSAIQIQAPSSLPDYTVINTNVASDIASPHNPYADNTNTLWHYTHPTSVSTSKTFSWTRRKDADISAAEASISAINGQIELKASKVDAEAMAKADYIGDGAPTLSNYPASDWANDTVKTSHIGETYYDKTNKKLYYFNGIPDNGVMLVLDSQSKTEPSSSSTDPHDYLQIFYSIDGVIFKTQKYYGNIGGEVIKVPSTELWVYWHTDNTINSYYGFSFSSANIISGMEIQPDAISENGLPDYDVVETPAYAIIESDHNPYKNNDNKLWKYTYYSGYSKSKTFSWTQTEVQPLVDAKTSILINSEGLLSKVSAGKIASTINQTAQSVLIDAQKINLQGYLTITDVGSGGTTVISGDRITTGTISADRIMGGTLKVGGSSSGSYGKNGAIDIYNSSNARIGRFDCNGLYMGNIESNLTSPRFSINTDGKINIRLSTSVANTVEMSTQGMICTYPNYYKLAIGSGTQYNAGVRNGTYPLIASRDTTYSAFKMALYNDAILFNTVNSGATSNILSTKGVILAGSVQLGMDRNGTEAPGYGARFQHGIYNDSNMFVGGKLQVNGTKNRVVQTSDYSKRLFYSYETASPMFGDVGEGIIGEDGKCYIQIDPIYAESVTLNQYQVFLQKYGEGECYVLERNPSYFVVSGTAGIKFGWEIKAKQSDFDQYRLERDEVYVSTNNSMNYIDESLSHIALINEERKPQND